jgi:hypothetical protein
MSTCHCCATAAKVHCCCHCHDCITTAMPQWGWHAERTVRQRADGAAERTARQGGRRGRADGAAEQTARQCGWCGRVGARTRADAHLERLSKRQSNERGSGGGRASSGAASCSATLERRQSDDRAASESCRAAELQSGAATKRQSDKATATHSDARGKRGGAKWQWRGAAIGSNFRVRSSDIPLLNAPCLEATMPAGDLPNLRAPSSGKPADTCAVTRQ